MPYAFVARMRILNIEILITSQAYLKYQNGNIENILSLSN